MNPVIVLTSSSIVVISMLYRAVCSELNKSSTVVFKRSYMLRLEVSKMCSVNNDTKFIFRVQTCEVNPELVLAE